MKYDGTITLGNVLTALAMLAAGGAAWTASSERLTRVEAQQAASSATDARHDNEIRDLKQDIKSGLGDIKSELRDLRQEVKQRR